MIHIVTWNERPIGEGHPPQRLKKTRKIAVLFQPLIVRLGALMTMRNVKNPWHRLCATAFFLLLPIISAQAFSHDASLTRPGCLTTLYVNNKTTESLYFAYSVSGSDFKYNTYPSVTWSRRAHGWTKIPANSRKDVYTVNKRCGDGHTIVFFLDRAGGALQHIKFGGANIRNDCTDFAYGGGCSTLMCLTHRNLRSQWTGGYNCHEHNRVEVKGQRLHIPPNTSDYTLNVR